MQIICPHCTTSYAVDPAKFGPGGRAVRCARCHETWLARPEQMAFAAPIHAGADGTHPDDGEEAWRPHSSQSDWQDQDIPQETHLGVPHVDSPSISGDWGVSDEERTGGGVASNDGWADEPTPASMHKWLGSLGRLAGKLRGPQLLPGISHSLRTKLPPRLTDKITLPRACAVMGGMVLALAVWRADVVRLMPQTAAFFKMTGMGVNLRGLAFEDVTIATETVNGKPVLVIEGAIAGIGRKPVELPRLRFSVLDGQGADIYAWNSVLEQPILNPGEKVRFKSRLASPPAEGREIAVRFFQRRDIVAGGV